MPVIKNKDLLKNIKKEVPGSYEIYMKCIEKLKKVDYSQYGSTRKRIDLKYLYENPEIVIKAIREMEGKRQGKSIGLIGNDRQASYINSICAIFIHNKELMDSNKKYEGIYNKWRTYLTDCNKIKNEEKSDSLCSKKLKDSVIPYEDVIKKLEMIRKKYKNPVDKRESEDEIPSAWYTQQKYVLLELITHIKPKRCELRNIHVVYNNKIPNEYKTVEIIREKGKEHKYKYVLKKLKKEKGNYLHIVDNEPMRLELNNYKTVKIYGKIIEEIPNNVKIIIEKSLKQYPRKCLFGQMSMRESKEILPYIKQQNYSKIFEGMFKTFFGKDHLTPTKYRHIFLSDTKNIDFNNMSNSELKAICDLMGTSVRTALETYRKTDITKEDEKKDMEEDEIDEEILESYEVEEKK